MIGFPPTSLQMHCQRMFAPILFGKAVQINNEVSAVLFINSIYHPFPAFCAVALNQKPTFIESF